MGEARKGEWVNDQSAIPANFTATPIGAAWSELTLRQRRTPRVDPRALGRRGRKRLHQTRHEQLAHEVAGRKATGEPRNFRTDLTVNIWGRFAASDDHHRTLLRCAELAVACERYRMRHGRWPATADDL